MKKFMFTAIAMLAFVGSSMANTIEIEKFKVEILSNVCDEISYNTFHTWNPHFGKDVATQKAKEAKDACEVELKKDKKIEQMDNTLIN